MEKRLELFSSLAYAAAPVPATCDTTFLMPVPAIFIAANFAFAGIVHYNEIIEDYSHNIKSFLVITTIIAVLCSIFASSVFSAEGGIVSSFLLSLSLYCLIIIYIGLLSICGWTHTASYERDKEAKRMVSASIVKQIRFAIKQVKSEDWMGFIDHMLGFFESSTTSEATKKLFVHANADDIIK